MAPFILHSLEALKVLGAHRYETVQALLPGIPFWFKQSDLNWMYGWLDPHIRLEENPSFWNESNGLGAVTYCLVIAGFWIGRKSRLMRLLAVVSIALIVLTLRLPAGTSLWKFIYQAVPGAGAVRAVGRIGMFLLLPAAIALATALQRIQFRFSPGIAVACTLFVAAEQGVSIRTFDKFEFRRMVDEVAKTIQPDCESFLLSPHRTRWLPPAAQMVALWAEITTGVPTLNGSEQPRNWPFLDPTIGSRAERAAVRDSLRRWHAAHSISLHSVCWVRPVSEDSPQLTMTREDFRPRQARNTLCALPSLRPERALSR